jgi:hypothetical protein
VGGELVAFVEPELELLLAKLRRELRYGLVKRLKERWRQLAELGVYFLDLGIGERHRGSLGYSGRGSTPAIAGGVTPDTKVW